ncbi:hypothetical protein AB0D04_26515 [Streptomyces sp. NPDC048483]
MAKAQNRKSGKDRSTERRTDREREPRMPEESAAERTQDLRAPSREA